MASDPERARIFRTNHGRQNGVKSADTGNTRGIQCDADRRNRPAITVHIHRFALTDRPRGFEAVHLRHLAVHDDQVVNMLVEGCNRLPSVTDDVDPASERQQVLADNLLIDRMVLRHQDADIQFRPLHNRVSVYFDLCRRSLVVGGTIGMRRQRVADSFSKVGLLEWLYQADDIAPPACRDCGRILSQRGKHDHGEICHHGILSDALDEVDSARPLRRVVDQRQVIGMTGSVREHQFRQRRLYRFQARADDAQIPQLALDDFLHFETVIKDQRTLSRKSYRAQSWRRIGLHNRTRNLHAKHRSATDFAVDLDPSSHDLDQLAHDRETQARAFNPAVGCAVDLPEGVKNTCESVLWYADTGVSDLYANSRLRIASVQRHDVNGDDAPVGKLDRVPG